MNDMIKPDPTDDKFWTTVGLLALCLVVGPSALAAGVAGLAGLCGYVCG